jgi:glycosyltransferase involved in cell wall biosynthesis
VTVINKNMKKLMYIVPHLSTGGMPQYLLKQIETFKDDFIIQVIEYNFVSSDFVVQRNKIKSLCEVFTLGEHKSDIIGIIQKEQPDIIHFQEIPETFVDKQYLNEIFSNNRNYNIVTTTHSSYTEPSELLYTADRFVLVSPWSELKFRKYFDDVECSIWEYPVENIVYDKVAAKQLLAFDPEYKHVLHVGLFTDGKNQGDIFELARQCESKGYKIQFHFVGNQAINFEFYWGPLMKNKPNNCIVHYEKENVSDYYKAADAFYFPSKWELNPLSVKEALSYGLPTFLKKLHTYQDTYDGIVTYIDDNQSVNLSNLLNILQPEIEIPGWFSYNWLYDKFIDESPVNGKIVEIGSWFGKSTNYLVKKAKASNKNLEIHCIDTFKGAVNEDIHQTTVANFDNDIYQHFYDNVMPGVNKIIKDTSHNASLLYKNAEIDYLMIDADHSYEGVMSDIKDYFYKVKPGGIISGDDYTKMFQESVARAIREYFRGAVKITPNNINWYYRIPRIQLIHMSTQPVQNRVLKSIKNIELLKEYNIDIVFSSTPVYTGEIDLTKYRLQDNLDAVRPTHYGCYLAHTNALKSIDDVNYDYTIIMEEDAFIYTGIREFVDMVHKAIFDCEQDDIYYVSLGSKNSLEELEYNDLFYRAWHQDLAHCYLIPNKHKEWYVNKIETNPWDVADLWYNHIFCHDRQIRLASKQIFSKQVNATSIIDSVYKKW